MFRKVLISTDFEDGLYRLGCTIPSLAEGGITEITFFHNVAVQTDRSVPKVDEDGMQAARARLEQTIQTVPAGTEAKISVTCGRPSDNILQQIESSGCEVVFLGTPTRNVISEKLFGSTTMKLVERTPVPMMIMRPQMVSTYTTEELAIRSRNLLHYLLIPYDGTAGSTEFLEVLKAQVQTNPPPENHQYWLLWVIDDNIRRELRGDNPLQDAREKLHKAADTLRELNVNVETFVKEGDPLEEILRAADQYDIGAIATSSRGIGGLLRWSVPSLTRELLRQSWHPVLYFPKEK
ncbi:MAG: universal stress protein [Cyanobacteria bacterium P01_A01_bin.70]